MELTKEERRYILKEFLRDLFYISDKEYQKRIWIRGEGPECDNFDEAVCRYSSSADSIFAESEKYEISDFQLTYLKKFHEEFKNFWEENDLPQLFIDTPEWTKITLMAKEVLQSFGYHKPRTLKIRLSKQEYIYLCKATFIQKKHREALLSAQQISDAHFINLPEEQAKEIRDLCGEQLQIAKLDDKDNLTPEGKILESLVDKFFIG